MARKTFTLIELLVVVAIIAVLVAVLLPALAAARDAGRRAACGANMRQIMTAFVMYGQDSAEWFSLGDWWEYGGTNNHDFYLGTNQWGTEMEQGKYYGFMALVKPRRTYQSWPNDPVRFTGGFDPRALYCPADTYNYAAHFPKVTWVTGWASYGYRGLTPWNVHPEWASWTHRFGWKSNYRGPNRVTDPPRPMVADFFCRSTPPHGPIYMVGSTDGSTTAVIDTDGTILQQGISWNRPTVWSFFDTKTNHLMGNW